MLVHRARDSDFKFQVAGRMPPARRPTSTGSSSPFVTAPSPVRKVNGHLHRMFCCLSLRPISSWPDFKFPWSGRTAVLHLAKYYIYGSSHLQRKQTIRIVWIPGPPLRPIVASLQRNASNRHLFCHSAARTRAQADSHYYLFPGFRLTPSRTRCLTV